MSYSVWLQSLLPAPGSAGVSIAPACACGRVPAHGASDLYWCRSCAALQCPHCSTQQVDTYFCPSCLNSVFTSPAFAHQNRCEQCVECPQCQHMLSSAMHKSGAAMHSCEYCKFSTEHRTKTGTNAGAAAAESSPDSSARLKETEQNAGATATFAYLAAHYKTRYKAGVAAAAAATAAAGMVGFSGAAGGSSGGSSGGLSGSARSKAQLFDEFESLLAESDAANPLLGGTGGAAGSSAAHHSRVISREFTPTAVGSESPVLESSNVGRWLRWRSDRDALLHSHHYTLPPDPVHTHFDPIPHALLGYFAASDSGERPQAMDDIATLAQRLEHPAGQHFLVADLVPRRKALQTKLAHRCSLCLKHLVKPGPGASKPTFEILSSALSFLPQLSVAPLVSPLRMGLSSDLTLYVKNPLEKAIRLWITLPSDADEEANRIKAAQAKGVPVTPVRASTATVQFARTGFPVSLSAFDDLAEENVVWHDVHGAASVHAPTDPAEKAAGLVVYRYLSKVGVKLAVTPTSHSEDTHFILLVHTQADNNAPEAAAGSPASPATTAAVAPIHTFAMHVSLGVAQP